MKEVKNLKQGLKDIRIVVLILLMALTISLLGVGTVFAFTREEAPAMTVSAVDAESDKEEIPSSDPLVVEGTFTLPSNLKAFYLSPSADFYQKTGATEAELRASIKAILAKSASYAFNGLIVDTKLGDQVIYQGDGVASTQVDALRILLDEAKTAKIVVYTVYHLDAVDTSDIAWSERTGRQLEGLESFLKTYSPAGILLDGYYQYESRTSYAAYIHNGGGAGYADWLNGQAAYLIKSARRYARSVNPGIAVGLLTDPVWAPKSTSGGIDGSGYSALLSGHADTKALVEEGAVDFVTVRALTSLTDGKLNFTTILNWWDALCQKSSMPLYVLHDGGKVGTSAAGWSGYDQLTRQVASAAKAKQYAGSIFMGYTKMASDPNGSTSALLKYFQNTYKEKDLFKDLTIESPKKTSFTTYEASLRFHGKYDPNFEVTINGKKITPSETGEFLEDYDLKIGTNTFVMKHKGKTITYTVVRKVKILQSVSPTGSVSVDGGSKVIISVKAFKGSDVYATINGKRIKMTLSEGSDEDERTSSYGRYGAVYTVPKATSKVQNLGSIKITGSYSQFSETLWGAKVSVNKYVPPVQPSQTFPPVYSDPSDPNQPDPEYPQTMSNQIKYKADDTIVYDVSATGADYGSPVQYPQPKGTIDYIDRESGSYYILKSGRKVPKSKVSKTGGEKVGNNHIDSMNVQMDTYNTTLTMNTTWKAPFNISFSPLSFQPVGDRLYYLSDFNANTVTITFDYTTMVPKLPDDAFQNSSLFSGFKWERIVENGVPKHKLILTLRQKGKYVGCEANYNSKGELVFRFNNPPSGLKGARIVLDPGHGLGDSGAVGSYYEGSKKIIVHESDLNWKMANAIKTKLEAQGATVYMLDSKNNNLSLQDRVRLAKQYDPQLFIAVHHNSSTGSTGTGVEAYYNTPFSKPLAHSINSRLGTYYNNTMYSDGKNRNRGDKFSEFYVTRVFHCPATLVEYGFVSNPTELKKINSEEYRNGLAEATVQGLKDYLS